MAQATALKTYDSTTNVRDVNDMLAVVAQEDTPFYSKLQSVKAISTIHEAQAYALTTGGDNAQIEGADYSLSKGAMPTTSTNWTQIFFKNAKVSKTQQQVQMYGIDDLLATQIEMRMRELATDVEKALVTGTGNSGASGTARRLKGVLSNIATNVETGTGSGSEVLAESMFNNALQRIYDAGGRPKDAFLNSFQKRKVSAFTASNTRFVDADQKMVSAPIDVYESDFGRIRIHLNPFMDTDKVALVQMDLWAKAVLRPFTVEDYNATGSYVAKTIEGELTLESRNEKGSGKIIGLTTS
jgi:hypothetical protein